MTNDTAWKSAMSAIWNNRWARRLALVAVAFEIYNALVLPAIRGTIELHGTQEAVRAKTSQPLKRWLPDEIVVTPQKIDIAPIQTTGAINGPDPFRK